MSQLHTLTVQDVLWINLQLTKKVQHFNQVKLEEAVFYQYAYGDSRGLLPQAGRFLNGFLKMHPFDAGNEATILVAALAFLEINGATTSLRDDAAIEWIKSVQSRSITGADAMASIAQTNPHFHASLQPDIRAGIRAVMSRFPCTLLALTEPTATHA
jgi:prophage maintenance system killer protein